MVAATWGAVAGAIITVGAEVAIAVGAKLSTNYVEAASVGGLFNWCQHLRPLLMALFGNAEHDERCPCYL